MRDPSDPYVRFGLPNAAAGFLGGASVPTGNLSDLATAADVASAMGYGSSPSWFGKGTQASGNWIDIPGTDDLIPTGTLDYQQASAYFDEDLVEFTIGQVEYFASGSASALDPGSTSFAIIWAGEIISTSAAYRKLCGKRVDASGQGYWLLVRHVSTDMQIQAVVKNASGSSVRSYTFTGKPPGQVIGLICDYTDSGAEVKLVTKDGVDTGSLSSGDASNAAGFTIGYGSGYFAPATRNALVAYWEGAAAEGMTSAHIQALSTYLSL